MADKTLPPLVFGDSVADGIRKANKLQGDSRSGAGPSEVRNMILSYSLRNSLEGRDVFIGTGIPNIPEQRKQIEEQIELVKRKGGRPILIGVGPGTQKNPTTGQNEFLAELAKRNNLPFTGPLINSYPDVVKDPMGLHLRPAQYKQFVTQFYGNAKSEQKPATSTQPKGGKFDPDVYLQDPNVNKFLDYINVYEGSPKANQLVGYKEFSGFDDHPRIPVVFNKKGDKSDAAGMFQILSRTWDGQRKKLGLTDFSLMNQKRAAVGILHDIGALPDIVSGNFDRAKPKAARQWASIPGSTIGLSTGQVPRYKEKAEAILGRPTRRAGNPMMPRVEAPVEDYAPGSTLEPAPRTAQQGPATAPPQQDQVTRADMERMGPSYQAAFAAMTLGDSREDDDEYDDDETIAERYLERREMQMAQEESTLEEDTTQSSPLASLSEISYQSPFAQEEQPVMLAEGGDPAVEKDLDYKEYVREQLRKDAMYAGLNADGRGSARQQFAEFELRKDPRVALMLMGNSGQLMRDQLGVAGQSFPTIVGRLGVEGENARAGVSGIAVRLPDGSTKLIPGVADVGYSTPLYKGNLDVSGEYGLADMPRPMYGGRVRYSQSFKDGGEARAMMDDLEPTFGQRMGAKLSDVATKGLINIYDAARLTEGALSSKESAAEKEQKMSAAHKIYLDTFGFRGRRDPVTVEYFNPEEQKAIADLIATKGGKKGSIQYKDYGMDKRKLGPQHVLAGKLDPYVSVNKSLGQFNYELDPKTNSYRVTDQYDFNPLTDVGGRQVSSDFMGDYLSDVPGLYNKARIYAGRHMPPGTGRKVDFTVPAQVPVKRADGSPIYGEIADSGPITADTRAAFANRQSFDPREALAALKRIGMEGVSNLESVGRRSVAALPGTAGAIESIFRDDKDRRFATGEEIERQYLPKRMTAPTKEAAGFGEIGEFIDPTIALKLAKPTAKATLAALKASGPQVESALMKAAPAAQPMGVIPEARRLLMETPETSLFVSKVDDFITAQKNPVTKQQLLGQMKGKFRDYEIGRVSSALADLPDNARLLPNELLAKIQSSYPTNRLKTYVLEPQKIDRWSSMDNVYSDQPVGVVNLRFDTPMDAVYNAAASEEALSRLKWVTNPVNFSLSSMKAQDLVDLSGAIKNLPNAGRFKNLTTELDNFYSFKNKNDTSLSRIEKAISAYKYPATIEGWSDAINDYYKKSGSFNFENAQKYANEFMQKEADKILKEFKIAIPSRSLDPAAFIKALQANGNKKMQSLSELEKDALIELNSKVRPEMEEAVKEFKKTAIYEGQHKSLTPKGEPVAFSRFVDHTTSIPGRGNTKVMHMIELQSDLLDDIFKKGSKSGNKASDTEELKKLGASIKAMSASDERIGKAAKALDNIRATYSAMPNSDRSAAYKKVIQQNPEIEKELIEYLKLRDKESKLNVRTRMGDYSLQEAFPGMEGSPQVVQQMMIKNAIGAAMQRGVNAVTFPGKESAQAQLYEKLYPNLKQAVKDIGAGLEVRQIELYDSFGMPYSHWGVVWDDSTAKKVLNQGIRFNKGGLVDKQDSDNRKFI